MSININKIPLIFNVFIILIWNYVLILVEICLDTIFLATWSCKIKCYLRSDRNAIHHFYRLNFIYTMIIEYSHMLNFCYNISFCVIVTKWCYYVFCQRAWKYLGLTIAFKQCWNTLTNHTKIIFHAWLTSVPLLSCHYIFTILISNFILKTWKCSQ